MSSHDHQPTDGAGAAEGASVNHPGAARRHLSRGRTALAGLLTVGVLAGGGVAYAASQPDSTTTGVTSATSSAANGMPGGAPPGGAMPADAPTGAAALGAVDGEQHLQGTVTATTADTITVKSTAGTTATYTVTSTSQVVKDGATATLADVSVGETVMLHLLPASSSASSTQLLVERLLVGTSATDDPAAGPMGGDGAPDGSTTSSTTSSTGTT